MSLHDRARFSSFGAGHEVGVEWNGGAAQRQRQGTMVDTGSAHARGVVAWVGGVLVSLLAAIVLVRQRKSSTNVPHGRPSGATTNQNAPQHQRCPAPTASAAPVDDTSRPDPDDPRKPESPGDLTRPSLLYVLRQTVREFGRDQCTDLAAALTYYAVLSVFPALVVVVSLLGVVGQGRKTSDAILQIVGDIAPGPPWTPFVDRSSSWWKRRRPASLSWWASWARCGRRRDTWGRSAAP